MPTELSQAERLKFILLAEGAAVTPAAERALNDLMDAGPWSPDDYASTRGLILRLDGDVWVNVPVARYNAELVAGTQMMIDIGKDGFFVRGRGLESPAAFWPPAAYHFRTNADGRPNWHLVVTHGDRVRLSPTIGCAMVCDFCNIPFDDRYGGVKPLASMLEAIKVALADERQPGSHLLISGGTPGPPHITALQRVYESVLETFPDVSVDIMMAPVPDLLDVPRLAALGVNELSINLEIFDEEVSKKVMGHKYRQGRQYYLDFLEDAAQVMGPGRVRSMLMVGIESAESTLAGVRAIVDRGCVPVLSLFKPDAATPMASHRPPSAEEALDIYLRSADLVREAGGILGPTCPPCTHNTLSFAEKDEAGVGQYRHPVPALHSGV